MEYGDKQFFSVFAQVLYRHAEIVSGAYKLRETEVGCGKGEDGRTIFRPLTEEEKLKSSMQIMQVQIHRLNELMDNLK